MVSYILMSFVIWSKNIPMNNWRARHWKIDMRIWKIRTDL
jgi:DNA modification methylase